MSQKNSNNISSMYEEHLDAWGLKEKHSEHPALHTMPSALYGYDAVYTQEVNICFTAFREGDNLVGVWAIYQGTMIRRYRFTMNQNDPELPEATKENIMTIECVEAIRDALKTGGLVVRLIYRDFPRMGRVLSGVLDEENGLDLFLAYNLLWAENYGVKLVFPNEGPDELLLLDDLENLYRNGLI